MSLTVPGVVEAGPAVVRLAGVVVVSLIVLGDVEAGPAVVGEVVVSLVVRGEAGPAVVRLVGVVVVSLLVLRDVEAGPEVVAAASLVVPVVARVVVSVDDDVLMVYVW